jgi:hypothetical protein
MNSVKKVVLWLLATSLVFAAAAILIPKKAVALLATNVFVTNPAVPVSGNVGINGTPTVQLAPGTMVGVTGGTFNFSNAPSTPIFTRDKDNPALTPFQTTLCSGISTVTFTSPCSPANPNSFTVGANQELVIEYVSVRCGASGSGWAVLESDLRTTAGGNSSIFAFPIGQSSGLGSPVSNQQTRIYADPNAAVTFTVGITQGLGAGGFVCMATLSGYLVTP